ncbi:MAG: winged helix-turn-helix domain-containing protein [Candidatus Thermoplasmatota archaeon]|nr:winged helix-turn-helix domain-containing protein [Candidatus Thermoplasmatota archaeon]
MKEGFIVSNKVRKTIFSAVASGADSIEQIAKKERLMLAQAQRALKDLTDNELIEEKDGKLRLTEEGEKTLQTMKKERMI